MLAYLVATQLKVAKVVKVTPEKTIYFFSALSGLKGAIAFLSILFTVDSEWLSISGKRGGFTQKKDEVNSF